MLNFRLTLLLATISGTAVATIYLNQPLLGQLAGILGEPPSRVGLIATFTQIGYGLGIFFLVPLGDTVSRRNLVSIKLLCLALVLFAAARAESLGTLLAASVGIGVLATVAQDMVVLTADLSAIATRGKAIGTVMSGLFMGILISRTFSGVVAQIWSWRAVFALAGAIQLVALVVLRGLLPPLAARERVRYASLIQTMLKHIARQPQLRNAVLTHGLLGMAFSAFWTCLAFYLSSPAMGLSTAQIGYFGLVGAAGTLVAPIAGRVVDKHGPFTGILSGTALVTLSFMGMWLASDSLVALIVGAFLFDMGVQVSLISHQTVVFGIDAASTSRLNAVFFTGVFGAFALGSAVGVQIYGAFQWPGVLLLGAALACVAVLNGWRMSYKPRRANPV